MSSQDQYTISSTGGPFVITSTNPSGTNGISWNDINRSASFASISVEDKTTIKGDLQVEGNVLVGGVNLAETLEEISRRLHILRYNSELESHWSELRELGEQYRALEAELIERELVFKILSE